MSKKNDDDVVDPALHPEAKNEIPTIEEHKENLGIKAPVFAAVMQAEGWAGGKRIPEADFKKAVESFLGSPIGGK